MSAPGAMTRASPVPESRAVLRRHGKSFDFAGRILGKEQLGDCAQLYSFCRYMDDMADHSADPSGAKEILRRIGKDIRAGESGQSEVRNYLRLAAKHDLDASVMAELIHGLEEDLDGVALRNWSELIRYGYRVAGTVGLLMAKILGAKEGAAGFHAIDLGIAMQLTNIARDVEEDAVAGRRYLPECLVPGMTAMRIREADPSAEEPLRAAVRSVLETAAGYYRSGVAGLVYLPVRARFSILVAARVYQAIGHEIRRRGFSAMEGRAVVSPRRKRLIALGCLPEMLRLGMRKADRVRHDAALHRFLGDLPQTHPVGGGG